MSIRTEPSLPSIVDRGRIRLAGRLMMGLFALAAFSQAKLQIFEREATTRLAAKQGKYLITRVERAKRGSIFTADGKAIAKDEDSFELTLTYKDCPDLDSFYVDLSAASDIPVSELRPEEGQRRKNWKTAITAREADAIRQVKVSWRADGVSLDRAGHRAYTLGDSASGIIGMVQDGTPFSGMEYSQRKLLTGKDGSQRGLTDRQGAFLPMRLETPVRRQDGKDITLTLDSEIQMAASSALRAAVEQNRAENGVAIVMNPATGDILAMANWPSFSPTENSGTSVDLRKNSGLNPAYMSILEPGSTFKILTLAKALDSGKVLMSDRVNCMGSLAIGKSGRIHCASHHGVPPAHHLVDAEKAIALSCNVSAATWALKVGREDFIGYVKALGLLKRSHLGLSGECAGQFSENEYAKSLQLASIGFGQSISCTPIGLASAFCMIGNGGVRPEARLIDQVGGETQLRSGGTRMVKPETASGVMRCMEAVIDSDAGTGKSLRIPGYRLAGKTGTAQKISKKESGYVSNFVGFVPAVAPKAMILVMINHPQAGLYYGAAVAGPVFKQLAESVIQRYGIAPTEPVTRRVTAVRPKELSAMGARIGR